ncbi:MAG: DUF2281 domain-containing protein [Leptolyngbyaceae cyanobacterium SL_5_9]|nr:DUF2281 domain-containing protein [Leptolyngbyaceae cyanobacterium SL_5_9]NJO76076.1 DUF2281 domain-containing protein [Leptolyngbyaceae cyanobacterium RM1_406_9]
MSTAETIYELVKTMPEDRAYMVLKFAEFLHQETNVSTKRTVEDIETTANVLGWEPGFFERTAGCLADDPIARYPQPSYDVRESLK